MAGTVSGGICAALEALGLIGSFDVIYGASSGAMNASYTAAGQAQSRSGLYAIAAKHGLVDQRRMLRREAPIRTDEIVNSLFHAHPHGPRVLDDTPELRMVATHVRDKSLRVLGQFESLDEVRTAIWASCAIPFCGTDVVRFRDEQCVDGGLTEPLPYRVALREGATHVLVARCRPVQYRKREFRGAQRKLIERLFRDAPEPVVELIGEYPARYNTQASELASGELAGRVAQLAPGWHGGLCHWLERSPQRLLNSVAAGAVTAYRAITSTSVGLLIADPASQHAAVARAA
jgi:predicted patatin/cPLA2 family phospholipase